jgi:hypothetical protein
LLSDFAKVGRESCKNDVAGEMVIATDGASDDEEFLGIKAAELVICGSFVNSMSSNTLRSKGKMPKMEQN